MVKFKVGDVVRALRNGMDITKGEVYTVIEVTHKYIGVEDNLKDTNSLLSLDDWELVRYREPTPTPEEHSHYFIDVGEFYDSTTGKCEVDVYVILEKFGITNPCLQHVAKKALATGKRGHKDYERDLQDIIDTVEREKVINSKRS